MKSTESIVMLAFGFLVVLALAIAIRQGAKHRRQIAAYAARHGWSVSIGEDPRLAELLSAAIPSETWRPHHVIQTDPPPNAVYLFCYQARRKSGSGNAWNGMGCLAEHSAAWIGQPVTISTRVPGLEILVDGRVDAGTDAFRHEFTVTCGDSAVAAAAVNTAVERALLEHAASPSWNLNVLITNRSVLASSFWAQSDAEWDYLIGLAKRIRAAFE